MILLFLIDLFLGATGETKKGEARGKADRLSAAYRGRQTTNNRQQDDKKRVANRQRR